MGVNGDMGCREAQDTVPFDDFDMVIDSSLLETPFQKLCRDTELVNSNDCADVETLNGLNHAFDSDVEVVNDSEDDDCGTGRVSAANSLNLRGTSARAVDLLLESDASNDHDCQTAFLQLEGKQGSDCVTMICNKGDDPIQIVDATDIHGPRMAFVDSQEPGESTQAGALDFVDHFLMVSDLNVSPRNSKNNTRIKSPPFSGVKGRQALAKRIKTQTTMKARIFDWTCDDPLEIRDHLVSHTKPTCFKTREDYIADNDHVLQKLSYDPNEDMKDSTHPMPRPLKNISVEHPCTEQASQMSPGDMFITQMDEKYQDVASREQLDAVEDLLDVGINTQIAAEAMGALLYAAPFSCSKENVCESDPCSFQEKLSDNVEGGARKPNEENPSSSRYGGENHLKLAARWTKGKRVKRGAKAKKSRSSFVGKLHRSNSSHTSRGLSNISCKLIEPRSAETANGIPSENHQMLIPAEVSSLAKELPKGAHFADHKMHSDPVSISEMRDRNSSLSESNDDNINNRFRIPNSGGSATSSLEKRNSKRSEFGKRTNSRTKVSAISCLLNLDKLKHPMGKRSRFMRRHRGPATQPCCATTDTMASWVGAVNAGWQNSIGRAKIFSSQSVKLDSVVASACDLGVPLCEKRQTSCSPSDAVDNHVVMDRASSSHTYGGGHESPCSKSLTRSCLLKELARLGGSGKAADVMWKDLRSRRSLGIIRVLFSQHLDDDTIKQQKKIMVRLGISLASSSADATHFVADRFARTRNMLEAMALGKPVVTHLWMESCGQARCLIDEKGYILRDSKKEKEIGFCLPTSLARARQSPLFQGVKVCITPNVKPDRGMIADLVRASKGQVEEISQTNDRKILDELLILSCEEDREICLPFINQGVAIYTSEFVLNGIVIQKLEYARHRLFTNAQTRKQANTKAPTTLPLCSAY